MLEIDKYLKKVCDKKNMVYSTETPSAENVIQDKLKAEYLMWRNIIEDGNFASKSNGMLSVQRHVQIGIYQDCKFDEKGIILNFKKEKILQLAYECLNELYAMLDEESVTAYQNASYTVGYDANDANKVYALIDLFIQTPFKNECV